MNVALHGMEAVATSGDALGRAAELPLLVRYADNFVILHPDFKTLQQVVRRITNWLTTLGLHLHDDNPRTTHTLISYQGQMTVDFMGFHSRHTNEALTS